MIVCVMVESKDGKGVLSGSILAEGSLWVVNQGGELTSDSSMGSNQHLNDSIIH